MIAEQMLLLSKSAPLEYVIPGDENLYRHFRCTITAVAGGGMNGIGAAHIRFKVGAIDHPRYPMRGYSSPSPYVATASHDFGSGYPVWEAFDDTDTPSASSAWFTGFGVSSGWIQLDHGAGNLIAPTGLIVAIWDDSQAWKNFKVEASNAGEFIGGQTELYKINGGTWYFPEEKIFVL